MISTTNIRSSETGSTERSPLMDQLAKQADTNRDGNVTTREFSAFLSSLTESLDKDLQRSAADVNAPGASAPPAATTPAVSPHTAAQALAKAIARTEGK